MHLEYRHAAKLAAVFACLFALSPLGGRAQGLGLPDIVAERAIVVDAGTGDILLDKSANEPVAMASLTKLFTAFVAIETTPLDRQMRVTDDDLVGEASMGLTAGEVLSFQTLLHGMLLPSGNDAAMAIGRNLGEQSGDASSEATQRFIERANARLATLGLHNTHLINPHGLDADGHYSTARDIAALTLYALNYEPTFAETIHSAEYEAEGHVVVNTNSLLGAYDGLIGGKTGVTDNAGYCLMQVAERNGQRIIIVLLGSTPDAWYNDAEALLDYGFAATQVPGAAPRFGQITFATTPAIAVPPSNPVGGLSVTDDGQGSATVSQTALAGTSRRPAWFWIIAATILAPVSLLVVSQGQRALRRRIPQPTRRGAVTASPHPRARVVYDPDLLDWPTPAPDTVVWQHIAPEYRFDETTDWHIPAGQPHSRRRTDSGRYPTLYPSYSGD